MGDAWFAVDKLYSRFTDKIDMTAEQAQAANDERYVQAAWKLKVKLTAK